MHPFSKKLLTIFYLYFSAVTGCKPLIHSFVVTPLTITAYDSVRINWSVRGTPTLLVHSDITTQPGFELREYKLVVKKNGRQTGQTAVVNVVPALSGDNIAFDCERNGDSLIAKDEKNEKRWGNQFIITSARSLSGRALLVSHGGRTALLAADGSPSSAFAGLANNGIWEIKSLLTAAEKKDSTTIPGTLRLQTQLEYKK